ncbi:Bulb-type lectin domain-containing protein [Psidium guajava]|nr:Bulb-type lectin domain-containing protein [Psidium guajava]
MPSSMSLLRSLLLLSLSFLARAAVPPSAQFKFVNEGEFGPYIVEYDGNYRTTSIFSSPFQLCFYNTTPNAFTLALRMATTRSESLFRWVWEANRGRPVRENATFALGADGNLVLADADGRVAWQSRTAGKGVVGFKLLPTGNMVLYDSKGKFVWQSFDSPTDTLLVGQSLRAGAASKLVSRASEADNSDGPYSMVIEPKQLSLYYTSKNSPKPLLYYTFAASMYLANESLAEVTLESAPETDEGYAYEITLKYAAANKTSGVGGGLILARPKYNATLTILRLGIDGNLRAYTYYDKVDYRAWEVTFSLFSRDGDWDDECQLPSRCGNFGLCADSQCVACPSARGLLGWSESCAAPGVASCRPGDSSYYKLVGVDHFLSKYTKGDGPVKEGDCGGKCSKDCKCLGYFYNQESSRCWIAYELKTLTKVANSTHVGYIKVPKK